MKQIASIVLIAALLAPTRFVAQQAQSSQSSYQFHVTSELVLVNVTVRDRNGNFVRGLKADDFSVLEDGKAQRVVSFDTEDVDAAVTSTGPTPAQVSIVNRPAAKSPQATESAPSDEVRNRRLLILFVDLSSMQPDDIERAAIAAQHYVDKQMSPADLVSIVSLGNSLRVDQDFTSDRDLLRKALQRLNPSSAQGFDAGSTGDTESTPDSSQPFTADETEFNIFNTDRRLQALRSLADSLSRVQQKKAIVYISSGISRTGEDNQTELRSAINAAVRANVAIYSVDVRGLQALPPGGEAQSASLRGQGVYSGAAVRGQFDANFQTQETLSTLAADTGGRAFLDSNDFGQVFDRVQQDTQFYYVLGYHSTNPARDGRYRRITVRSRRADLKLEFRNGYYAPRDFQHSNRDDREQQLEAELNSELPSTDLPVFLSTAYFRMQSGRFFVPVAVVVPGSEIPFTRASDKDKATLDVIGIVREANSKFPVANVRDTVKLAVEETKQVQRKNVQYDTGFTLSPGSYHLKFVLRENQTGRMGSFETDLTIPDLKKTPLKMSSVVLGSQMEPARRKGQSPLVRDGSELVPSVTRVFRSDQTLYLYYEVYDPARQRGNGADKNAIHVLTNISFFQGRVKAFDTPLVESKELNEPQRGTTVFQFQVPLSKLHPGYYSCQINVIDDAAGTFAFPRVPLLVREAKTQTSAAVPASD
jgi:VWFA-related protein